MHLIVDGIARVFATERADPIDFVYNLLLGLTEVIGMQTLTLPYVVRYAGDDGNGWESGISGFTMISASHIDIHTKFANGQFNLDIYSCRSFDVGSMHQWLVEELASNDEPPERMEIKLLDRNF